jgi:hypothetical protein
MVLVRIIAILIAIATGPRWLVFCDEL